MLRVAMAAHEAGDIDAAEAGYRAVLDLSPDQPDALHLLGMCRYRRKCGREAFELVSRAVAARPDVARYHNSLGLILRSVRRLDLAARAFARALRLTPDYRDAQNHLALTFGDQKRYADAETVLRHALASHPADPVLLTALGRLRLLMHDGAGALSIFRDVLKEHPDHVDALNNLGVALNLAGERESARVALERALALDPGHVDAHCNLGQLLLAQGDFTAGWRHHEWRLQRQDYRRQFPVPMWQGEPLDGRTILIWCEQGLGDAIQFIRYAPLVAARGGTVIVECRPPLRRLIAGVDGVSAVFDEGKASAYQCHVPVMSLPAIFGTTADTIPADIPYVAGAAAARIDGRGARMTVGLIWAGNPDNLRDSARSLRLADLAPLAAVDDVAFFSLQVGAGADDPPPPGLEVLDLMPQVKDFHDTAGDMKGLDLIISIDSSGAHLAGALGCPVWVLLNEAADWRWLTGRDDTPWYPTMRLFRRKGGWDGVFSEVIDALSLFEPDRSP